MDNNTTLFNHSICGKPPALAPATAARLIVALQAFDSGGIKSDESAKASPLIQAAVYLIRGGSLFETLMLNLHQYNFEDEEPFAMQPGDCPAWERDTPTQPVDRPALGYLDLLTWQSRRLLLVPEHDAVGKTVVRKAVIMKGYQFSKDFELQGKETMVAYRAVERAKEGQPPWSAIGFREERALWRDSLALMRLTGSQSHRPKIFDWHCQLVEDLFPVNSLVSLDVFGLTADKATLLFWRHERFNLPTKYFTDDELLLDTLKRSIQFAEEVARLLGVGGPLYQLAKQLVGSKNGGEYFRRFGAERFFWPSLEASFRQLLEKLPTDENTDNYGQITYGDKLLPIWQRTVRTTAGTAFYFATDGLHRSSRAIKDVSKAELRFLTQLKKIQLIAEADDDEHSPSNQP